MLHLWSPKDLSLAMVGPARSTATPIPSPPATAPARNAGATLKERFWREGRMGGGHRWMFQKYTETSLCYLNFIWSKTWKKMGTKHWMTKKWCILYLLFFAFVSYYYDFPTAFWFAWIFWNHKGRWFVFSLRHKKLIIQTFLSLVVQVGEGLPSSC